MRPSSFTILAMTVAAVTTPVLVAPALAQSAATDPVGFVTLNVAAAPANDSELSYKSLSLSRPVEYQGAAEFIANAGQNGTFTDNEANWTNNQFNPLGATEVTATHYLEIVRPVGLANPVPGEGSSYDILVTDAASKSITISGNLPSGVVSSNSVSFKIRKYWTIGDVFGPANESGLGGGPQGEADDILIYSPQSGGFKGFYYQIGGFGGSGWRSQTGESATNQKIYPEDGIVIRRRQTTPVNILLMGAVKTGSTSTAVVPGTNFLGNIYAANMTLASSKLYTGNSTTGVLAGAQGEADDVLIYDQATKAYKTYYYNLGGFVGNGWVNADTGALSDNVLIPSGSSIVVRRRGATGFDWVAPQHPASL